jgi:hypothetical protein
MLFSVRACVFLALSSLSAVVAAPTKRATYNNRAHVLPDYDVVLNAGQRSSPGPGPTRG